MNEDDYKSVDKVSTLIEPQRDKDGKHNISLCLLTRVSTKMVITHLPQEDKRIVYIVMNVVLVLWMCVILVGLPGG